MLETICRHIPPLCKGRVGGVEIKLCAPCNCASSPRGKLVSGVSTSPDPSLQRRGSLGDPIGDENIEFPFGCGIAVGGPYELFAIRGKHGKTIEISVKRNLLGLCPIVSDHMQMK